MKVDDPLEFDKFYQALLERNSQFVGSFYVGVKTTGIFCIATCRAKKPKAENVEFFTELKEVLQAGYRPCKICKPTENATVIPGEVAQALAMLKINAKEKISDFQLKKAGLHPEKIRRWFKSHYGITFQAYQRMLRINMAYQELQKGNKVTDSAFEVGYDSLSGFGYTFKKILGSSPKASKNKELIIIKRISSPIGPMYAAATNKGICLLEFTDRRMLETEFRDLQRRLKARIIVGENEYLTQLEIELEEYFEGKRKGFEVKLDTPGTDFQQIVWKELQSIPYGSTSSYQKQAHKLNKPNAVRAVAAANGHNRVSIIIPCHRVIGKDGSLTGYGGGLERKKWLLQHEFKNKMV